MKKTIYYMAIMLAFAAPVMAQEKDAGVIDVSGNRASQLMPQSPATTVTITSKDIADTVNAIDTPDALKYVPSLFVRKRDSADYGGATLQTRIWGVSYSAKSIVNVDGVPISNSLYNDNNYGPPKWFMVSPEEIRSIDVMYGPFSAAYSGNSMGAVVNISTQMPEKFTAIASLTGAIQTFSKFGTTDNYATGSGSFLIGDKSNDLSWRLSVNHEVANTQPRAFVTSGNLVTPYAYSTKVGANGGYYDGASTLLHGVSDNLNLKLSYNLGNNLSVNLHSGIWAGQTDSGVQTYLTGNYPFSNLSTPSATPASAFAGGVYNLQQLQYVNSASIVKSGDAELNWKLIVSNVYYDKNLQRTAGYLDATTGQPYNNNSSYKGTLTDYNGSGWTTADYVADYKVTKEHVLSFGAHYDYNRLNSVTFSAVDWLNGSTYGSGTTLTAKGVGASETKALWIQDSWNINQRLKLTAGLRYENWNTFDGALLASGQLANPPVMSADKFSPKLSLAFDAPGDVLVTTSLANAARFPTPGELYNVAGNVGGTCANGSTSANGCYYKPTSLKPEDVWSAEMSFEKRFGDSFIRTSLFAEQVSDALISSYGYPDPSNPNALFSTWQNIKKVRTYGIELAGQAKNLLIKGFDFGGSVTLLDSRVVDADQVVSTNVTQSVVGNPTPGASPLRITGVATYRPDEKWALTVAGRYQKQYATSLDNGDVNANTYLGFSGFFVVDVKARYQIDKNWRATFGIDNLNNYDYFLYHPFPQRTFVANLRYSYN